MSNPSTLTYDAVLMFWRMVINLFFREIRPRGAWNIPKDGPLIFVAAPHNNQFLDPLLLFSEAFRDAGRRVSFLIAENSMKRKFIGFAAGLMMSIPVARAQDNAKKGSGLISLSPDDPCKVFGVGTKFTEQIKLRSRLLLSKATGYAQAEVTTVISDTELLIKREFGGESGKGTARVREKLDEARQDGLDGLDFKILPYIDQKEMYRHVYQKLREGGCIGIFPEGGSHDRTDLLPLKIGVSLMALGAMAEDPNLKVKIVPVGLSYFHPHRFRSRAVIEFGHPLDVPEELVETFKAGGEAKRKATTELLDLIYDGLKTVTVRAPDYETLMLIQAARRLYKTPGQHLTLGQVVEMNRRLIEGYVHFQDEPKIRNLKANVLKYNRLLRDLGLKDHQVPQADRGVWKTLGLLTYRVGLLTVWTILALPGVVLNGPIFIAASMMSRIKAKEALAASTVKIRARDVIATWKILISLGMAPVLYGLYAGIGAYIAARANAPLRWRIWTPFLILAALPCIGYSALKFGEAGMDVLKSLSPLIIALFPGQQKQLDKVRAMREQISNELSDVINEYGPKLYSDFNEWRILVPSASVPPSTGTPGIWRRKSGIGGVDAQGSLLVHPMSWLDERLFGWSKSVWRGTSVWGGSGAPSGINTPELSDDEGAADYDNVLGYLNAYSSGSRTPGRKRARSTHQSYADLQQWRKAAEGDGSEPKPRVPSELDLAPVFSAHFASSTKAPTQIRTSDLADDAGLVLRKPGSRERRQSLSDLTPVERIGQLPLNESFREDTKELNRENEKRRLSHGESDSMVIVEKPKDV